MTAFRKIRVGPNCTTIHQRFYESVEEGDDYRSEEDIYTGNSQSGSPSVFSPDTSEALNLEAVSRKRAVSDCEYHRTPAEFKRARATTSPNSRTPLEQTICFILPEVIWANIFSLLHPAELGRQRRTCKLFKSYLDNENIWKRSRKRYLPDHPKPVFGLDESEMLSLILGTGCMLCEKGASRREHSSRPPNVKARKAVIYWPFRVRCCKVCLEENTTKEFVLLSSESFPDVLLTPLPFGIVDLRNNWISNSIHYQPNIGLTRIFWNADIQDILERYQEAKDMKAQEEWLKCLEAEGMAHKLDIIRIERFENMKINGSDPRSACAGGSYPGGDGAKLGLLQGDLLQKEYIVQPGNIHNDDQCREGPALHQNPSVNLDNSSVTKSSAVSIESKAGLLLCEPESAGGANNYFKQFDSSQVSGSVQVQHTVHEALEVKSKRRADIEFRCLQMRPFLKPEFLAQLPAFQAAIKIPLPLTEYAWENLKVKLLKQISDEDEQSYGKTGPLKIKLLHEDRKILEQKQKETKERKEIEWDELQVPVRARLIIYADEITKHWLGCITKDTASKFAVDVLSYCRRRFYEETPYSTDDPHRINPLDTTTRVGKATLEVPTTRRLTLENMKFVFDNKIRPLTDQFGRELFACSGCEHNSRLYAFEGAIQHYAAKHTSQLSFGPIVVHWRTDWPEKLPFKLDPVPYPTAVPFFQSDMNISQCQFYPSLQTSITHQLPGIFAPVSVGLHTSHSAYNFSNYSGYNYPPHHRQVHQEIPQSESISQTHCIYLEQISQDSREAWFQLSGIKDLPSSVRVHYLISKIVPSFQNKFSCEPSLAVFIEALKEYKSLKPIRNTNGLHCLECYKNPPPSTAEGNIRAGRLFAFSALLQHFETIHILRNRAMIKPDWKTEMVKLPETRVIGMISQAQGMDVEKYSLLKGVFPLAFPLPFPGVSSSGIINEATRGVPSEGHINTDMCNPPKEIGSEQKGIRLKNHKEISTTPARMNPNPQQDLHIGIDCQRSSHVNSNDHRCRSLMKIHEPELQTKSPQCVDKPEMTAAELFLENFLRNTEDSLQLDRNKEKEKIAYTSVVISEKAHDSSAYSPDPYPQGDRDNILEHDRSSLQITPNKPRKHNRPIEPPAFRSNQHDRKSMPRYAHPKCPTSRNMPRLPETALHKISNLRNSPTAPCHTSKRSYSYHDIDDYKPLRQQSAYLKEKYSEPLYPKESNKYYDTKYPLPSPASPLPPPPPQPLSSDYYSLKDYKKGYRGTEWSHIPPLVYPAPPLPSTIPSGGCYVTQYEFDYRGQTTSRDPLIPLQSTTTQYRPYPPLRSPVREAAYRGRSRSPVVSNRCSYKEMAPSYETEPVSLHRGHVTSEHDQYKTSGWNKDRDYHQQYATPSIRDWPQVKSFEKTKTKMVDLSYGKGESCGRGGGGRGIIKVEDIDDMRGTDKSIKTSFSRY